MVQMFSASNINKITNDVKNGVPERQDGDGRTPATPTASTRSSPRPTRRRCRLSVGLPLSRDRLHAPDDRRLRHLEQRRQLGPQHRRQHAQQHDQERRRRACRTSRCWRWSSALYGRRLCENTVGLLEEKGVSTWQSAGAVDKTEWVHQIRTLTTIFPPYQLQEDGHPNYWGQLALRNCFRQAYNGGARPRRLLRARHRAQRQGRAQHDAGVGVRSGAWSAGSSSYSRCSPAGSCVPPAHAAGPAPLRRRDVRLDRAAARTPREPNGRKIDIAFRYYRRARRDRAADRRRRGRAGLPVDRARRSSTAAIFGPLLQTALAAAGRQPRDRRLGADRLHERAVVRRAHVRQRVRAPGRALRARDRAAATARGASSLFATAYAVDDLAAVLRALRDRGVRPLRRLLRHVLRAGLRRPPSRTGCARWSSTRPIRGATSTRGTCPRAPPSAPRWRPSRPARSRGSASCSRSVRDDADPRPHARRRQQRAAGPRRPARARRPGPGLGLGPGDPARARRLGARRAGRRRRAAAAARRPGEHVEPHAGRGRLLLARRLPGGGLPRLPAAVRPRRVARASAAPS